MRIGIIGGGQLGKMLSMAAMRLDVSCSFWLDGGSHTQLVSECGSVFSGTIQDESHFESFLRDIDVLTVEYEHVPLNYLKQAEKKVSISPSFHALAIMQDRLFEKCLFEELDIRCAPYCEVSTLDQLKHAAIQLGFPFILKTRRSGYDGKGQHWFESAEQMSAFCLPDAEGGYIAEAVVPFQSEVSLIAVRSQNGQIEYYPLTHNQHEHGILRFSYPVPQHHLFSLACSYAERILSKLDYIGVFTLECFVDDHGLIANEMAPRVHNSGHWTIEGAITSQFENHLRAILNWPLGKTACVAPVMMTNIIGEWPNWPALLSLPNARIHHYGKSNRPGRKLGHITTYLPSLEKNDVMQQEMIIQRIFDRAC